MEYRDFGRTGLKVSVLGFGGMRIPNVSEKEAIEAVHKAIECGINFFETAPGYGDSEIKIGKALRGIKRDKFLVSSKSRVTRDPDGPALRKRLKESLKRFRLNYLDFYQMWGISDSDQLKKVLAKGGPLEEARKAKSEGLIRHIGFTTHETPENIIKMIESGEFESVTLRYHILDQSNSEAIQVASKIKMGVVIMTPLGGGWLANPAGSASLTSKVSMGQTNRAFLALRFLFSNHHISTAISGMKSAAEVEENVKVADKTYPLTKDEKQSIRDIQRELKKLGKVFCSGCNYCAGCPENVWIPEILQLYNLVKVYNLIDYAKFRYDGLSTGWAPGENATKCTECGLCIKKCPNKLNIPQLLKEAHFIIKGDKKIN